MIHNDEIITTDPELTQMLEFADIKTDILIAFQMLIK